ncbi:MAG TPA: histidinol dehydrogenase [Acidobacteriaceae bacterium]|nr:histidinol dehydrogenase [Acidobacteriaceae bacterium]
MELLTTSGSGARKVERLLQQLERRGTTSLDRVERQVRRIVDDVRRGGDRALLAARAHFDGVPRREPLRITPGALHRAWEETSPELHAALKLAARNIMEFAKRQLPQDWDTEPVPGVKTGQRVRPLAAVGCYVPSGRHPLPSSLLMTAIPAQIAGVRRIVVVSPRPARETLAAAALLGIDEMYQVGGAQAIAALAYGTPLLPRVDKIAGPGNVYVTAAKRLVAFDCGIDMLAGPTEIVVCSERGHPEAIAADLVAQAEHDTETLSVLVTSQAALAKVVVREVKEQSRRNPVAREALRNHAYVIVTEAKEQAREIANRIAAEHLTIDSEEDLAWVQHAGSVFIGNWSSQPLGDYVSGPNHTLPTGGAARIRGGLSVMDFIKLVTVQSYNADGVRALGPAAVALANAEGLSGHAEAVGLRITRAEAAGAARG